MNTSWQPMSSAPRNATWVELRGKDGLVERAHWASDLSGEDQPPFEGWFKESTKCFVGINFEPVAWRHQQK